MKLYRLLLARFDERSNNPLGGWQYSFKIIKAAISPGGKIQSDSTR